MNTWFPRLYDAFMQPLEWLGLQAIRKELISKARGRVLEIGSGTGLNFPYYDPEQVTNLVALEPDESSLQRSLSRLASSPIPAELISGTAESIPCPDNSFDTVVGTLVLCTVQDPRQSLEEFRRVLKPDGIMLFFEHVRVDQPVLGYLQDRLTPFWKHVAGGCHLNRNTLALIKAEGFEIVTLQKYYRSIFWAVQLNNRKKG